MTTPAEMADALRQTKRMLTRRLTDTTDVAETAKIEAVLTALETQIDRVTLETLNDAAAVTAAAADGLLAVVRTARTGALDGYLQDIGAALGRIRVQIEDAVNSVAADIRSAPKTEDPEVDRPLPPPNPTPTPPPDPMTAPAALPAVVKSKAFANLQAEYAAEWTACQVRAEKAVAVNGAVARLNAGKQRYQTIAATFNGMPWYFVGIIHAMEAGFRFDRHLHNGDPLTARTIRVPRGRPPGAPPFHWEASARDALASEGFDAVNDWSIPHMLHLWERYNGLGYRFKGLRTPYLWSFSNLYSSGRYVADGVFDPNSVSKQCGAAAMLKGLDL
jgi:lysozyme family protein